MMETELQCHALQGASAAVQVLFMPKDGKTYQGRLPVYLDGQTAQSYFTLEVQDVHIAECTT